MPSKRRRGAIRDGHPGGRRQRRRPARAGRAPRSDGYHAVGAADGRAALDYLENGGVASPIVVEAAQMTKPLDLQAILDLVARHCGPGHL
jgi:hypothetical protein